MRRHDRWLISAVTIALAACVSSAKAQGLAVFDPLNYGQNLLTAARALENLQNQVRMLQGQAQQLLRMDQNLRRSVVGSAAICRARSPSCAHVSVKAMP